MSVLKKYAVFVAVAFLFLVHLSYLPNGFVWLDHGDIEQGRAIVPLTRLTEAFFARYAETGFYRPMVTASLSLDAAVYGLWAPGFHLTNLLLHLAVAGTSGYFLSCFFPLKKWERMVATLLVGVSPVSFLPVGVISYRQELLLALFSLLSVILFSRRKYGYASISFLAAAFSKETAVVVVPAFLLVWEMTRSKYAKFDRGISYTVRRFTGLGMVLILYIFLRQVAVSENWHISPVALPLFDGIGTRISAVSRVGMHVISPILLSLSDATPVFSITHPVSLAVTILLLLSVWTVVRCGVRRNTSVLFILCAIVLIPAMNIVPLPRFFSPHYGYLASIVVCAVPIRLYTYLRGRPMKYVLVSGIGLWILIASYSTYSNGFRLRDDTSLFLPEVTADPHFREGASYLGDTAFFSGHYDRALQWYETALRDNPEIISYVDRTSVLNNTAGIFLAQNRVDDADALLSDIPLTDDSSLMLSIRYNRALIAYKMGRFQETVMLLDGDMAWSKKEPIILLMDAKRRLHTN